MQVFQVDCKSVYKIKKQLEINSTITKIPETNSPENEQSNMYIKLANSCFSFSNFLHCIRMGCALISLEGNNTLLVSTIHLLLCHTCLCPPPRPPMHARWLQAQKVLMNYLAILRSSGLVWLLVEILATGDFLHA